MKFGRTYNLVVQGEHQTWNIAFPRTLRFKVTNAGLPSANSARFLVYNLDATTRHDIFHDPFQPPVYKQVALAAGYQQEPKLPIIFQGNIYSAFSYRLGPDWITEIEAYDGGFAIETGQINVVMPAGDEQFNRLIKLLTLALPNVSQGVISRSLTAQNARGAAVSGNSWDQLIRRVLPLNAQVFISKEVVNVIAQNEYLETSGGLDKISSDTGLIGSPRRQNNQITVQMVFEPRLEVGQKITLESVEPANNGDFKVMALQHEGTISAAVCGEAITQATFFYGTEGLELAAAS